MKTVTKKIYLIIFILLFNTNSFAEELYLRCIPIVTDVIEGELKKYDMLHHRILYAKFKNEYDLERSDEPERVFTKYKLYLANEKGKKKTKFTTTDSYYSERSGNRIFKFKDDYESKSFRNFSVTTITYDGANWVISGNQDMAQVKKDELKRTKFSWNGPCLELTKKQFKKRMTNEDFFNLVTSYVSKQ